MKRRWMTGDKKRRRRRLYSNVIQRSPVWGRRFGHTQVNWSHGRVSNSKVKTAGEVMDWKHAEMNRKKLNKAWQWGEIREKQSQRQRRRRKKKTCATGEKWTEEEFLQKQKGGSTLAEACEVHGSLQSKQSLTEGLLSPSGWAREGTATRRCEMWQIYFRAQAQEPFPALNQVSRSWVKGRAVESEAPPEVD